MLASVNLPQPSISVILFFFIRKWTPLTRPSATFRLRSKAAPKSKRRLAGDAERLGLLGEDVGELGVAQQRLARDAADVEADPAPVLLLDDRGLAQLSGADGGHVPAGIEAMFA